MSVAVLRLMFQQMVENKDPAAIRYAVEYDEQAWVETADKVAGRVWITTSRPGESPTRIEVVLIAAFTDGRISRVWETTWPSWNSLPAFETY